MLHNLAELGEFTSATTYDTCVIGAGAAGITISRGLAARGQRVLLLEAGAEGFTKLSQDFYQGQSVGRDYYDLQTARLRYFGGTTNHWTGWCRAFDALDFQQRDGIPMSGWPIRDTDIRPYYKEAMSILEIENEAPFLEPDAVVPHSDGVLRTVTFGHSLPVRFAWKYGEQLAASESVDVLLNATAIKLISYNNSGAFNSVQVKDYRKGVVSTLTARRFVLSMGGVENARFLLLLNRELNGAVGNSGDMVGRCFMEHPAYTIGGCVLFKPEEFRVGTHYALTEEALVARRLGQCIVSLEPVGRPPYHKYSGLYGTMRRQAKDVICDLGLDEFVRKFSDVGGCIDYTNEKAIVKASAEQHPNLSSRVSLSKDLDDFGQPRCKLNWQLSSDEKTALKQSAVEFGRYFAHAEKGRFKASAWLLDDDQDVPSFDHDNAFALWHHMGTTRMSDTPDKGVVDANCRVHGVRNLYVAGSSVFSTSGFAQPTFTIVALALRLAEHLARDPE